MFFSGFIWFHHSSSLKKLVEAGENVEDNVQVLRSWVSIAKMEKVDHLGEYNVTTSRGDEKDKPS